MQKTLSWRLLNHKPPLQFLQSQTLSFELQAPPQEDEYGQINFSTARSFDMTLMGL